MFAAAGLLCLVAFGVAVNLYAADERLSPVALVALLTASLGLLGVSYIRGDR
jgi:hypothetical protein